jgi:hypothetical protein
MATSSTMSIADLASVLGISRSHCFALAARDALPVPTICCGRRKMVSVMAVDELFARRKAA